MPKLTSSVVTNLRLTLASEPDALYCPGAVVRGVMTFTANRPLSYRSVTVQLSLGAVGKHKDHPVTDSLAHYITYFIGEPQSQGEEGIPLELEHEHARPEDADETCCPNQECDHDAPVVVGQVVGEGPIIASSPRLPAGDHRFPFAFVIPTNAPATVSYRVMAHKLDVGCTLLGVVSAEGSWAAMRTALQIPIVNIVPRFQFAIESAGCQETCVVPLSGVFSNNGAAEVRYSVSHTFLCLQDPQPFIISMSIDNVGGKKSVDKVSARLVQFFDLDLLRRGSFIKLPTVIAATELHLKDGPVAPHGRGGAGGHLSVDLASCAAAVLPTMTTEHLRVRHVLQLELKGGKAPVEIPVVVSHFIDDSNQVSWWHYEKPLPSLRLRQWYEVPAPDGLPEAPPLTDRQPALETARPSPQPRFGELIRAVTALIATR